MPSTCRAHTDGDLIVHFRKSDVVHIGDVNFNGSYPFIDVSSGSSAEGAVAAADRVLALATVLQRIKDLRQAGKSDDEIRSAKPAADFDARYGNGFIKPELFIQRLLAALPR